jgi:hypothetical protein
MFTLQRIFYLSGYGIALAMALAIGLYRQENLFKDIGIASFGYWFTVLVLDTFIEEEER